MLFSCHHRLQAHRLVGQQLEGPAYKKAVQEVFDHHPTLAEQHQQAYAFATTAAYRRSGSSRNARAAAPDLTVGRDAFAALSQSSSATGTPTATTSVAFEASPPTPAVAAVLEQQQELAGVVQAAHARGPEPSKAAPPKVASKDRAVSLGKQLSRQASQRAAALAAKGRATLRRGSRSRCEGVGG